MTPEPRSYDEAAPPSRGGGAVQILLASSRDWFASALKAVLEPEGFTFTQARSGETALEELGRIAPDLVIIDEGLPDLETTELCRRVTAEPAGLSLPVLVYSPNFWQEAEQAEAMRAGAWDVIREPVRSVLLVAKLRRLLRIRDLIQSAEGEPLTGGENELFSFAGLVRVLPVLGSLAERNRVPLSCAFFGPTRPRDDRGLERQRNQAARLCASHTRMSDICACVDETDLVLVAYDADASEATLIMRRLNELAERDPERGGLGALSAGIVELLPSEFVRARPSRRPAAESGQAAAVTDRVTRLSRFAAAQSALREAREAGGGIRIAEAG